MASTLIVISSPIFKHSPMRRVRISIISITFDLTDNPKNARRRKKRGAEVCRKRLGDDYFDRCFLNIRSIFSLIASIAC